jgi:hypothetical protein
MYSSLHIDIFGEDAIFDIPYSLII